jgi:uncharacterized membrane protein YbhN (UPF0104 family)
MTFRDDAPVTARCMGLLPMRPCLSYAARAVLVLGVGTGGLWAAAHGVAGVALRDVARVLGGVSAGQLALLATIWAAGLGIYSLVLSAAMPGLGVRRSLLLNLGGSAVANVVPLGGAVATALNWRMARTWGHSNVAFIAYCVLTNALDVLTKLVLPVVAVTALAAVSIHVPPGLWLLAAGCAIAVVVIVGVHTLARRSGGDATRPDRHWRRILRCYVKDSGERIQGLLRLRWTSLLPGSVGYIAAQVALLFFSLRTVGLDPTVAVVVMAAAIERLGTLVPITPGGTGVAEIGTIAWLVASGLDPVDAVAGVLLYRFFLIALEVPVGVVLLGGWAWAHRRTPLGAPA